MLFSHERARGRPEKNIVSRQLGGLETINAGRRRDVLVVVVGALWM